MWLNVPEELQAITTDELDEIVDLSDGETVQVTADVGEVLVSEYDDITEHDTNSQ